MSTVYLSNQKDELELLDEDFNRYLSLSKLFLENINRQDRKNVGKYIRKCCSIKSINIETKQRRNSFFKYFLKMLHTASLNQLPNYDDFHQPQFNEPKDIQQMNSDNKTYIAAKVIPGYGNLIYMAVSNKPELGWVNRGLEN